MLRRIDSLFTPGRTPGAESLVGLVISDYVAYYRATPGRLRWGVGGSFKRDSPRRLALLFLPRAVFNPCLHATTLIRLAARSPTWTLGLWRTLLIAKHTIDIQDGLEIGPGLVLPHPFGITFGWGTRIGRDVTILHHVTIGGSVGRTENNRACPTIGNDVVIWGHSLVLGPITLGEGAVVGAGSWLDHDLAPGEVHRGRPAPVAG